VEVVGAYVFFARTEKLGDVERDATRAQVDVMRSVIEKNRVDSIERKITIMQKLKQVYVSRMGRESYESQLLRLERVAWNASWGWWRP
jgi:hypothetical protein